MNDTITSSTTHIQAVGYDILTPILQALFGGNGVVGGLASAGFLHFLGSVWGVLVVLSFLVSFVMLALYIYASIETEKLEEHENEHLKAEEQAYIMTLNGHAKNNRFANLQKHTESNNPNDWKLAIIEADIILDDVLKRQGYAGATLGERLKSISPSSLQSLDDAWQAHKVRNNIAHAGADFVLTNKIARETVMQYERVLTELGVERGEGGH